ncbi:MAG: hypothetical protein JSR33_04205 [Proteobacteria bacterium]|nr:hypothetical protein [Pseudomonadota bacterium]
MNNNEQILLGKMEKALYGIYYGKPTIIANYYYSPRPMHGKQPSFLSSLKNPEQYKVSVPGVKKEDFKFYYISANVERSARKK